MLLRYFVQVVSLASQLDVVDDVWRLADQLVRLHDEAADVPRCDLKKEVAGDRRNHGSDQPAASLQPESVGQCDSSTNDQCHRDNKQSRQQDVGIGVGDSAEDGVVFSQLIETP